MSIVWDKLALGDSDENLILESVEDLNHMVLALFQLARRQVLLRAPRLEWPVFASQELSDEIGRIVKSELSNQVLVLIEDEEHFFHTNSRVLALCRRFSSYVKLRLVPEEYREPAELFLTVDNLAFMHQARADVNYAVANLNAPGRVRTLSRRFNEIWERSEPPAELFTLGL